jgi:hypothetical protein
MKKSSRLSLSLSLSEHPKYAQLQQICDNMRFRICIIGYQILLCSDLFDSNRTIVSSFVLSPSRQLDSNGGSTLEESDHLELQYDVEMGAGTCGSSGLGTGQQVQGGGVLKHGGVPDVLTTGSTTASWNAVSWRTATSSRIQGQGCGVGHGGSGRWRHGGSDGVGGRATAAAVMMAAAAALWPRLSVLRVRAFCEKKNPTEVTKPVF